MPSQTGSIDLTAQVSANNNAKDYSDNVVDNLVVGGRNLFVNGSASNGYPTDAAVGNTYGISNMSTNHEAYEKIPVEEDSSYVVQYWVDDSAHAGWVCIQLLDSSDIIKNKICRTYPAADYWTTTIDIPTGVSQMLVSGRHLASGYAYAKIKVEKGNKPTDWTPAPEDQEAFSISSGVEYIEGTQSSATNLWTGVTKESSLVSGKTISYKLPFAGNNSAATLNLTLSDGSTTGAKAVKQIYTTASNTGALADITTHWPVGSVIPMTYDGDKWIVQNYNTNVDHYDRIQHNNTIKSASEKATGKNYAVVSGSLIGYISALSGYQTILGGSVVDISKPLLWGSGNVAASTNFTNAYEIYPSQTVRNNAGSSWTGTTFSMVYLFGTLNGTNLTVDSTVFTSTIPATEDGKVYIPIGILYSAYQIGFRTTSDIYAYKDGEFGKLSLREASAASKTATNYISADSSGIKIHMAGNLTTYQHQASDRTTFYVGGQKRSEVGADGLKVYIGTDEMNPVASFGTMARIGKSSERHIDITSDAVSFYDSDGSTNVASFGDIVRIGDGDANHIDLTSDGFEMLMDGEKVALNIAASATTIDVSRKETISCNLPSNTSGTFSAGFVRASEDTVVSHIICAIIDRFGGSGTTNIAEFTMDFESNATVNAAAGLTVTYNKSTQVIQITRTSDSPYYSYSLMMQAYVYYIVQDVAPTFSFGTIFENDRLGGYSSSIGYLLSAPGDYAMAVGLRTTAFGESSHAEGNGTTAYGESSHAEGNGTLASGESSHAEGSSTESSGVGSHAEGFISGASAQGAHAEGGHCHATAPYAHAQNLGTKAASSSQTAIGVYNVEDTSNRYALIIGKGTSDSARSNAATIDWNGNYIGQAMAGIIQMFAGATPPTGWLVCDGSAISRTTYATLFAAIGTTWGAGDGSTTFNVPDLRGRMPMGAGTGSGLTARTLGNTLGAETHNHGGNSGEVTLSAAQSGLPAHTHSFTQPTVKVKYSKAVASGSATNHIDGSSSSSTAAPMEVSGGAVGAVTGGAKNASSAHKHTISSDANIPPAAVVNFIICTGKTS